MAQEVIYVPITPAKSGLNPKGRVFGDWETAFGCPPRGGGFAAECSGELGMNTGFCARGHSGNCGAGDFVADPEKMSFTDLLGVAVPGTTSTGATLKKHSGGVPDGNGITIPPTPMEKEQVSRKKQRQQKVKRKKHRPKIFDESKPRRIPKVKPKREIEKSKTPRKSSTRPGRMILETILNPQTPKPLVEKKKRKASCKRGINFNLEDLEEVEEYNANVETTSTSANSSEYVDHKASGSDMEYTVNSSMDSLSLKLENKTANICATNVISAENDLYEKRPTVDDSSVIALAGSLDNISIQRVDCAEQDRMESLNYLGLSLKPVETSPNQNGDKEMMGVMNHNGRQSNSLQVYQRIFRANEPIKNIRKLGPNCPSVYKGKRTKRQKSTNFNLWFLEKVSEQTVIAPHYALRSNFKKCSTLAINSSNLSMLPTKSQIKAAMADHEPFKCPLSLSPIVKSRRRRSKRFLQSYLSHSPVTHSQIVKKSSNVEFLCQFPQRKRSKKRGQCLQSSDTITGNIQNNLTSVLETLSIRRRTEAFKLEARAECDNLFDVTIYPNGYDMIPMAKDGSHTGVELKLHPPLPEISFQEYELHPPPRLGISLQEYLWPNSHSNLPLPGSSLQEYHWPIAPSCRTHLQGSHEKVELRIHPRPLHSSSSTPGSKSKFKVQNRLRHRNNVSKTDSMLSDIQFLQQGSQVEFNYLMESNIQKLEKLQINELQINDEHGQLVVLDRNLHGALILYKDKEEKEKRRKLPKVDLDPETIRRWNLLMENDTNELPEDVDEKKKKDWEEQREIFSKRCDVFITCMQVLQGDRSFSPWKGSVVDSVVGVFLTQNVSDYLSSNAFMSLAAKFPVKSRCCDSQVNSPCSQESTSNTTGHNSLKSHETFISSGEKEPGSLEDEIVVEHPSTNENSTGLKETLEFEQSGNSEKMILPQEVELPSCGSADGTRLCGCESEIITSNTERLEDLNMAHVCSPVHNGCTSSFDGNLGFGSDSGEHENKKSVTSEDVNENCDSGEDENKKSATSEDVNENFGSKNGCASVSGMLEEVAKASTNSNTLLNELEVAMEDNTVLLNSTPLEENTSSRSREKKGKVTKIPKPDVDWEELRRTYYNSNRTPGRNLDSIDWDAVRCAPVGEIAKVIETRGMNNVLAAKIKAFLNRLVEHHGSIDLEWLKDVPPEKAKEFLLSIRGVGLKSTECVRLLTLGHHAFPVDTNIARIVVRLGWVPLEPLPGDLQIHLLEQYPQMDAIQKYLWPRLCTLNKDKLYVLHYQLITFGKVICTKKNPNCNACPMRAECRHFASAFASSRLRLRGAPDKRVATTQAQVRDSARMSHFARMSQQRPVLPYLERDIEDFPYGFKDKDDKCHTQTSAPAIEMLASSETEPTAGSLERDIEDFPYELDKKDEKSYTQTCEPIIEVPASPEPESLVSLNIPEELEDEDGITHIKLDTEEFKRNLLEFLNPEFEEEEVSNALVALTPSATTIPAPKIKSVERLRTRHRVYTLPDTHQLLAGFDRREHDDPCPYLLAIWPKETESLNQKENNSHSSMGSLICDADTDNGSQETNDHMVFGTILIPCRTANKGSFPLNGTYFQVNEVFADHESSECPINVPRNWIWRLTQRNLYCGSTASAIARGMEMEEIQQCFWNGFLCVRAFDRRTRNPVHLSKRFHELPSVAGKKKIMNDD